MDSKLASSTLGLMKVELRLKFECCIADSKGDWLKKLLSFRAWLHNLTEIIISNAIQAWNIVEPFFLQDLEHIIWNTEIRATSINNSSVSLIITNFSGFLRTIADKLTFECPLLLRASPIWSISLGRHFLESINTSNNLVSVKSSKYSI